MAYNIVLPGMCHGASIEQGAPFVFEGFGSDAADNTKPAAAAHIAAIAAMDRARPGSPRPAARSAIHISAHANKRAANKFRIVSALSASRIAVCGNVSFLFHGLA